MARKVFAIMRVTKVDGMTYVDPAARVDREALSSLPHETLLEVHVYNPHTDAQRKFLHDLLKIAADNAPIYVSPNAIKLAIKLKYGFVEDGFFTRTSPDGTVRHDFVFKSVGKMNKDEVREFIEVTKDYIATELIPGCDIEKMVEEAHAVRKAQKELRKNS